MRVGVLTSSRADYGIYLPLLKALKEDAYFELELIVFGTHLSKSHGETINQIYKDGFVVQHTINTISPGDSPADIAESMGRTLSAFARIWSENKYDLIFALGDRYEMFAACASIVPFVMPIAHLHGGETTIGAIDDAFRHSITHMSSYHFTAAEPYKQRVVELKNSKRNIFNVGALAMDNLHSMAFLSIDMLDKQFGVNLNIPSILITFHPETVAYEQNETYVTELVSALEEIKDYQLIITMPNSDTMGNLVKAKLNDFIHKTDNAFGIESFGMSGYLSCMKYCSMMLGNTSSGFLEAGFFPKQVINLGDRQTGRIITANIENCKIEKTAILEAVRNCGRKKNIEKVDVYGQGNTASNIISHLKAI